MMSDMIGVAEDATTQVIAAIHDAQEELRGRAAWVNGLGVLSSKQDTAGALDRAIARLTDARQLLVATKWPTSRDYDAAEAVE